MEKETLFTIHCGHCGKRSTVTFPSLSELCRRYSSTYLCPLGHHEAPGGFLNCLLEIKALRKENKK